MPLHRLPGEGQAHLVGRPHVELLGGVPHEEPFADDRQVGAQFGHQVPEVAGRALHPVERLPGRTFGDVLGVLGRVGLAAHEIGEAPGGLGFEVGDVPHLAESVVVAEQSVGVGFGPERYRLGVGYLGGGGDERPRTVRMAAD